MKKNGSKQNDNKQSGLSFQQSIDRISEIVTIMEDGACELEDMVSLYEEGVKLIQSCNGKLDQAKMKIAQINKTSPSQGETKSFAGNSEGRQDDLDDSDDS